MNRHRILVVDDEPDICALVKDILEDEGFKVTVADNAQTARAQFSARRPDLVLLDIWMPGEDGISLLKSWQEDAPSNTPVVIMSGHGTVETAVEATRLGARGFIEKPLTTAKLLQSVQTALAGRGTHGATARTVQKPVGDSPHARRLREEAKRLAQNDTPVMISGETGAGKATFAEYVHSLSTRADNPFITLAGATLDSSALSAALTAAQGGTLLVRQIHEMTAQQQHLLVQCLRSGKLSSADVRLIITSLHEGSDLVQKSGLVPAPVKVAPLREHTKDIPELLNACTDYLCQHRQLPYRRFSIAAQNRLLHYNWPDNLSELNRLVQCLLESDENGEISLQEVEAWLGDRQNTADIWFEQALNKPIREAREMFERFYLRRQLELVGGSVSRLAAKVGMERTHLYRKLRSLDIHLRDGNKH